MALAVGALVGCCLLWGLNQVAAKAALAEIPPLWQAAARSLGGCAAGLALGALARHRAVRARWHAGPAACLPAPLFAAEFACIFIGLQYTTASRMVVFIYLSPFVVALGMPFIARSERLACRSCSGSRSRSSRVAWAFAEGFSRPAAGERQWIGDALGVLAAALWGATTLAIRGTRLTSASAEKTLLYQLAVSGVLLALAALTMRTPLPAQLSTLAWSALAFQIVIVTFMSYLVWFWLVRHYPATRLASFTLLTPIFGLLAGALLLGEPITTRLLVALVGVAGGIYLVNRKT